MRLLLLVAAASLTACSGLPPETLPALKGGEVVTGVTLAFDMQNRLNPDVGAWFGAGLGHGVDASIGVDLPAMLVISGPAAAGFPLLGIPPGLSVRKTFENGLGVGVGSGSRFLFTAGRDSSHAITHLSTAGVFVTTASREDRMVQGRATLHVGYAQVRRPNTAATERGLAVHVAGQAGPSMALGDTARVLVPIRIQGGAFVWPRRSVVQGPTFGLGAQMHEGWK